MNSILFIGPDNSTCLHFRNNDSLQMHLQFLHNINWSFLLFCFSKKLIYGTEISFPYLLINLQDLRLNSVHASVTYLRVFHMLEVYV